MLALIGFIVAIAYWPQVSGSATTPRWAAMAFLLPLVLVFTDKLRITWAHIFGLLFISWAVLTYAWSDSPQDTVGSSWYLLMIGCAFCLGAEAKTLKPVYMAMAAGLAVSSFVMIFQIPAGVNMPVEVLGFPVWEFSGPAGLFVNRNFFAEICALVLVGLVAHRLWWWTPFVLPAMIVTEARGAILAAVTALTAWIWSRSRLAAIGLLVAGCASLALVRGGPLNDTGLIRVKTWGPVIEATTVLGHGLGSYFVSGPELGNGHVEHPHNEFLEYTFEVGWIGAALLAAFLLALGRAKPSPERFVLFAVLVEAFFEFPFHEPATAFLGSLVAGACAGSLRSVRDSIDLGRNRLRQWLVNPRLSGIHS